MNVSFGVINFVTSTPAAAKSQYEALKQQTREELKHTLDELLEGDDRLKSKRWNIHLDVAASQIIIPHDFTDQNTVLVVFDLGHLLFKNMSAGIKEDIHEGEEEEGRE